MAGVYIAVGAARQRTAGRSCRRPSSASCSRPRSARLTHLLHHAPAAPRSSPLVRVDRHARRADHAPGDRRPALRLDPQFVPAELPTDIVHDLRHRSRSRPTASSCSGSPRLLDASCLWLLYRYTKFGLGHHRGGRERARRRRPSAGRPTASPRSTGCSARRSPPGRDPDRPDRHAAGDGHDEPDAGGDRRRAGRRVPLVPDRARRRPRDRHRPDRAQPLRHISRASATRCRSSSSSSCWCSAARRCRCATTSSSGCRSVGSGRSPTGPASRFGVAVIVVRARGDQQPKWIDSIITSRSCIGDHPAVDRRAHRLRGAAVARPVRDRRLRRLGRRPPGRRPRHRRSGSALLVGVRRDRPARGALRAPGRAHARHQPGDRHPRPGHGDRADAVQQPRLHRRDPGHPGRQTRRCSGWTSTSITHPTRYGIFDARAVR